MDLPIQRQAPGRGVALGTVYFRVFARLTGGGTTKLSAVSAPITLSAG
jgi:hypothetical protein